MAAHNTTPGGAVVEVTLEPSNADRIAWAKAALVVFCDAIGDASNVSTPECAREALVDLLTDLHHYCHQQGISFDDAAQTARNHFEVEVEQCDRCNGVGSVYAGRVDRRREITCPACGGTGRS